MMGLPMGGWGRASGGASNQPTMANRGAIGERGGGGFSQEERGRMESEAAEKERRGMGGGHM